ncbi:hypothetical protein [Duganella sp. LjRoot269]|uniref:hypothetical protein n=1 Tax=Duganella sp. LjRoot269 TaxID=3342305 RepID=UPI003ECC1CF8
MNAPKKPAPETLSPYKLAAAARRAKIAAAAPLANAVTPSMGRIRISLSGTAIRPERQTAVFGPASIDIPEFSAIRRKKSI